VEYVPAESRVEDAIPVVRTSVPVESTTAQFLAAWAVAGSASPKSAAPATAAVRSDRLLSGIGG
jgi:hypothetical protein